MSLRTRSSKTHSRCVRSAAALFLFGWSGRALAQTGVETKVARPLPVTAVEKTPAPPVVKSPGRTTRPAASQAKAAHTASRAVENIARAPRLEFDRVYFDAPGDGSLWARGRTYKASFDADGATYVPYLGASAPKNYPVHFELASVRAGDLPIAFSSSASAQRAENRVSFDRGGVVEQYDLAPDSIEQSFVVHTLPARGELALRIEMTSELTSRETADGFELAGDRGAVRYGRAFVADAAGRRTAAESVLVDGAIEIRVPADFMNEAVLPVTIDPIVTTFIVDNSTDDDIHPDIAYDQAHDRYCVCWEYAFSSTDHDVYVQMQNAVGGTISGSTTAIDITTNDWSRPKIANNRIASQFLVVAQVGDPSGGARIIRGRTRDVGVVAVGPQFTISSGLFGDQINPDVGGDPNPSPPTYYCVVWERVFDSSDHDVFCQLVRADSSLLDPSNDIVIDNTSGSLDTNPSVSKSDGAPTALTQEWNIVWQREVTATDHDIHGAQMHWDGTLTTPSFAIDTTIEDSRQPSASSLVDGGNNPRRYMAVWHVDFGSDHDVYGVVLKGSNKLTGIEDLTTIDGAPLLWDQVDARVDSDGVMFGVVYRQGFGQNPTQYDPIMSTFAFQGGTIVAIEAYQALSFSTESETQVQITSRHSGGGAAPRYAMVWTAENPSGDHDIRGALFDTLLVRQYCFPGNDGVIGCPCGNGGTFGQGCNNSAHTGGGYLYTSGTPSLGSDDLVFAQSGEIASALSIVLQGDANVTAGASFGDGVRCVGGSLKRLYTHNASGGIVSAPVGSDAAVHTRSAALGDALSSGDTRYYQVYYRDPNLAYCPAPTGNSWNVGNGLIVTWIP